ncbi:hypothetical protein BZA77DRAFT_319894 [Pyronema omphalodes]|nr:hypothetical protein BZA77DRAFT_319894 [Pyronema omphalodes]
MFWIFLYISYTHLTVALWRRLANYCTLLTVECYFNSHRPRSGAVFLFSGCSPYSDVRFCPSRLYVLEPCALCSG